MFEETSAYEALGGRQPVLDLAEAFYDAMDRDEPALAAMHERDDEGRVSRRSRDRFGLFLVGWLGGPQDYMAQHGHPRLRMRHAPFPVDSAMRDAWLRAMRTAMNTQQIRPDIITYLDQQFSRVADFLRNTPDA